MEELNPCPFCSGAAELLACDGAGMYNGKIGTERMWGREFTHRLIKCKKCGIRTKAYATDKGVIKAWNTRAGAER